MSTKSAQLTEISLEREQTFDAFRRWGYLDANLNPFGGPIGGGYPELPSEGEGAEEARQIYCGTIGAEFMHLPQRDRREWMRNRMENPGPQQVDRRWLAERLLQADLFEQILQTRYLGTKRYSAEGATALIPLLDMFSKPARNWAHDHGDGHEPSRAPERDGLTSSAFRRRTSSPALKTSIRAACWAAAT